MSKNCELVDLVVSMLSERIKVCDVVRMEVSEKRSVARRCGSMLLFGVVVFWWYWDVEFDYSGLFVVENCCLCVSKWSVVFDVCTGDIVKFS